MGIQTNKSDAIKTPVSMIKFRKTTNIPREISFKNCLNEIGVDMPVTRASVFSDR
jgi:hypothetical protein